MDSDRFNAQVERLDVVETGRRRRLTDDEKLRIVLESGRRRGYLGDRAAAWVSRSLLLIWRRSFGAGAGDAGQSEPAFVPAMLVDETASSVMTAVGSGRMVIETGKRYRVIVDASVDANALARGLAVLERR